MTQAPFPLDFLASCGEPVLERVKLGFECGDLNFLRLAFDFEPIDGVFVFAEFGKLVGVLIFQLVDGDLEAPCRHCEFCAQRIFVGLDFRHRLWDGIFQPPRGKPHSAAMDKRDKGHCDEGRQQKPYAEIHDGFDHLIEILSHSISSRLRREWCSYLGQTRDRIEARSGRVARMRPSSSISRYPLTSKGGHLRAHPECPLCAKSGHTATTPEKHLAF